MDRIIDIPRMFRDQNLMSDTLQQMSFFYSTHNGAILDDPTYLTFRVEFGGWGHSYLSSEDIKEDVLNDFMDFDSYPLGLTFRNVDPAIAQLNSRNLSANENYEALTWLYARHEDMRAQYLKDFYNGMNSLQRYHPYMMNEISGLDKLVSFDAIQGARLKDCTITIKCYESIDQRIKTLMKLYRKAAWDDVYQRWILPDNMRQFKMIIYITEVRQFHKNSAQAGSTLMNNFLNLITSGVINFNQTTDFKLEAIEQSGQLELSPVMALECAPCEFEIFPDLKNAYKSYAAGEEETGEIRINVKNVREFYVNNVLDKLQEKLIGDQISNSARMTGSMRNAHELNAIKNWLRRSFVTGIEEAPATTLYHSRHESADRNYNLFLQNNINYYTDMFEAAEWLISQVGKLFGKKKKRGQDIINENFSGYTISAQEEIAIMERYLAAMRRNMNSFGTTAANKEADKNLKDIYDKVENILKNFKQNYDTSEYDSLIEMLIENLKNNRQLLDEYMNPPETKHSEMPVMDLSTNYDSSVKLSKIEDASYIKNTGLEPQLIEDSYYASFIDSSIEDSSIIHDSVSLPEFEDPSIAKQKMLEPDFAALKFKREDMPEIEGSSYDHAFQMIELEDASYNYGMQAAVIDDASYNYGMQAAVIEDNPKFIDKTMEPLDTRGVKSKDFQQANLEDPSINHNLQAAMLEDASIIHDIKDAVIEDSSYDHVFRAAELEDSSYIKDANLLAQDVAVHHAAMHDIGIPMDDTSYDYKLKDIIAQIPPEELIVNRQFQELEKPVNILHDNMNVHEDAPETVHSKPEKTILDTSSLSTFKEVSLDKDASTAKKLYEISLEDPQHNSSFLEIALAEPQHDSSIKGISIESTLSDSSLKEIELAEPQHDSSIKNTSILEDPYKPAFIEIELIEPDVNKDIVDVSLEASPAKSSSINDIKLESVDVSSKLSEISLDAPSRESTLKKIELLENTKASTSAVEKQIEDVSLSFDFIDVQLEDDVSARKTNFIDVSIEDPMHSAKMIETKIIDDAVASIDQKIEMLSILKSKLDNDASIGDKSLFKRFELIDDLGKVNAELAKLIEDAKYNYQLINGYGIKKSSEDADNKKTARKDSKKPDTGGADIPENKPKKVITSGGLVDDGYEKPKIKPIDHLLRRTGFLK